MEEEKESTKDWIFTFGYSHCFPNRYIIIHGTERCAREEMFERFGDKWSFQYPMEKKTELESHGIKELK